MIATADIGPRIVHLSRGKGDNLLKLFEEQIGEDRWKRVATIWRSPDLVRTGRTCIVLCTG